MTTKLDYLKRCILALHPLEDKNWYISSLGIPLPSKDHLPLKDLPILTLIRTQDSLVYVDHVSTDDPAHPTEAKLVPIVDWKKGQPLFYSTDHVIVDNTWLSSVSGSLETTVGCLMVNAVALNKTLGSRFPYVNGHITVSSLESAMGPNIKDPEEFKPNTRDISITEYLECKDRLWFFTKMSPIVTSASSRKMITPAPGTDELRKKLLKEAEGKLADPVTVAGIMQTLDKHDKAYLAGDRTSDIMSDGKATTARKKINLMYGETNDFVTSLTSEPITTPMSEGINVSPDTLYKYMNDLRLASYSRGNSTQLAGYTYKILQRSLSGVEITDTPCKTTKGLIRTIDDPRKLHGRYARLSNKWTLIATLEEAATYKGKKVEVRSPMECRAEGFTVCADCMGSTFRGMKNAMNNIAAGFSGELMSLFLKRMHTSGFKLTDIDVLDLIT